MAGWTKGGFYSASYHDESAARVSVTYFTFKMHS